MLASSRLKPSPPCGLRRIQAAEAQLTGLGEDVHREDAPPRPSSAACGASSLRRKLARRLLEGALVVVEFKIHDG
jgi:hypothetical protein